MTEPWRSRRGRVLSVLALLAFLLLPLPAEAQRGIVSEVASVGGQLRFWLAECGSNAFFYFSADDPSREQARLIVLAAKFSGRPVEVSAACPAEGSIRVTDLELVAY